MKSRLVVPALALSLALGASCAGPKRMSQVRFGVWAAEHDLWEEAVFRWGRALEADPDSPAARNNLAVAYERLGRPEDARREYERALKIAPDHPQIKANFERFKRDAEADREKSGEKKEPEGKTK
ncbi:MAG: tetratricopeptide repeat protein [Candidatus Aminicenantes bacterium]|nr:tetratricopeptide repeat protein [Candidatus Aminicenantes bacterium]